MTFARIDGRNVISLQFNPYHDTDKDPAKQKELEQALKELMDSRENKQSKFPGTASTGCVSTSSSNFLSNKAAATKEKQEQSNIKKAWINIVKRDIPKAYRQY